MSGHEFSTAEELFAKMKLDKKYKEPDDDNYEKMKQQIESTLETYDFPPNWIMNLEYFDSNAKSVYGVITKKMMELAGESDDAQLKFSALKIIGEKITQIFLGIYLNEFDKVDELLEDCKVFIRHCCEERKYVSVGYLPGILHCLKGLEAYFVTLLPSSADTNSLTKMKLLFNELGSLYDLGAHGYVGLLAIKQCFLSLMHRKFYAAQDEIIRAMTKLNPESGEWNRLLYKIKRHQRLDTMKNGPPPVEETELMIKAAELSPSNPLVLISLCDALADVVKGTPNWTGQRTLAPGRVYWSSEEIVDYIRKETRHALDLDRTSVKTNLSVARMFSAVLPRKFRDFSFAKSCIERALVSRPNSSKANRRMAIFCLTVDDDPKEGGKYFERSLQADPGNFTKLVDLLQTYIANCLENREKIDNLLERELRSTELSESDRGRLYFVKGVYEFLSWKTEGSIESWIFAVENLNFSAENFKKLGQLRRRYGWPEDRLSLNIVYAKLSMAPETLPLNQRLTLDTILICIGDEMAEDLLNQLKVGGKFKPRGSQDDFYDTPGRRYAFARGGEWRGARFRGTPFRGKNLRGSLLSVR